MKTDPIQAVPMLAALGPVVATIAELPAADDDLDFDAAGAAHYGQEAWDKMCAEQAGDACTQEEFEARLAAEEST